MKNLIGWESWNVKEEEILLQRQHQHQNIINSITSNQEQYYEDEYEDDEDEKVYGEIKIISQPLATPFGVLSPVSIFKPSERWECWIGNTNFRITYDILDILNNSIPGIEALSIMGAYTFCIGIPKMFDASEVKRNIEQILCGEEYEENNNGGSMG